MKLIVKSIKSPEISISEIMDRINQAKPGFVIVVHNNKAYLFVTQLKPATGEEERNGFVSFLNTSNRNSCRTTVKESLEYILESKDTLGDSGQKMYNFYYFEKLRDFAEAVIQNGWE